MRLAASVVLSLSLLLVSSPTLAAERAKIPAQAALDKARKDIKDIYQPEFAKATTAAQKAELAKTLIDKAAETAEPASNYMLLTIAQAIAVQSNNVAVVYEAIDALCEKFEVDAQAQKKAAVESLSDATRITTKDRMALISASHRLAVEAVRGDDFPTAAWAADVAVNQSKKLRERSASHKYEELQTFIKLLDERAKNIAAAKKTLVKQPDSASANEAIGRFYCFCKNDWDQGLPMLALGGTATLKGLAVKELKGNTTTEEQVVLADGWWDVAAAEKDALSQQCIKQRAIFWYEAAMPSLSGLNKDKAKKRIAEKKELAYTLDVPAEPTPDKPVEPDKPAAVAHGPEKAPKWAALTASGKTLQVNLLNYIQGPIRRDPDGAVVLMRGRPITTSLNIAPAAAFKILVRTNGGDVRIAYGAQQVIFNWEGNRDELRIDGGPLNGQHKAGAGRLPDNEWVAIQYLVNLNEMVIVVNGDERLRTAGDFSQLKAPFKIWTQGKTPLKVKMIDLIKAR